MNSLIVFNTCEASGCKNFHIYAEGIQSILDQKFPNFKLVISGCKVSDQTRFKLEKTFGNHCWYNWIPDLYPLGTTFNHTVKECYKLNDFSSVVYFDSGVSCKNDLYVLEKLWIRYKTNKYSMVAHQVDTDTGYSHWKLTVPNDRDLILNPGKTVNLHCQLFGKELFEAYDKRILPDVFASDTSESIFPYMCAALGRKFVLCHDNPIAHKMSADGPSIGFRKKHSLLYRQKYSIEEICKEGNKIGFGYEECASVLNHDKNFYDINYKHKDPESLKKFIKEYCFFSDNNFYSNIKNEFIKDFSKENYNGPKITCVLLIKDSFKYKEALDSVLHQTVDNWELIVLNTSNDNLPDDQRIKNIRCNEITKNEFSKIISFCNGRTIVYLNETDLLYSNAFEQISNWVENNPQDRVLCCEQDVMIGSGKDSFFVGVKSIELSKGLLVNNLDYINNISLFQIAHANELKENWLKNNTLDFVNCLGQESPIKPCYIKIGISRK